MIETEKRRFYLEAIKRVFFVYKAPFKEAKTTIEEFCSSGQSQTDTPLKGRCLNVSENQLW